MRSYDEVHRGINPELLDAEVIEVYTGSKLRSSRLTFVNFFINCGLVKLKPLAMLMFLAPGININKNISIVVNSRH